MMDCRSGGTVDMPDSKSGDESREGSIPSSGKNILKKE